LCIKLEINQGYTTVHGQPVIKILKHVVGVSSCRGRVILSWACHPVVGVSSCRGRVIPLCIIIRNNQENLLIKKTYNSMWIREHFVRCFALQFDIILNFLQLILPSWTKPSCTTPSVIKSSYKIQFQIIYFFTY
jgi:hypothetical protein